MLQHNSLEYTVKPIVADDITNNKWKPNLNL